MFLGFIQTHFGRYDENSCSKTLLGPSLDWASVPVPASNPASKDLGSWWTTWLKSPLYSLHSLRHWEKQSEFLASDDDVIVNVVNAVIHVDRNKNVTDDAKDDFCRVIVIDKRSDVVIVFQLFSWELDLTQSFGYSWTKETPAE